MSHKLTFAALALTALALTAAPASQAKPRAAQKPGDKSGKMVAYDAKDRRYYSVAWAKAHGMRDKGGDALTIVPFASLPKDAKKSKAMKESKAMKGAKI